MKYYIDCVLPGKTAAFMLPVLERLLYKPKQAPVTRVLVLTPTRELAVQIYQVSRQLAQFTNVDVTLAAGECSWSLVLWHFIVYIGSVLFLCPERGRCGESGVIEIE